MPELDWYHFCPRGREVDRSMYEPLAVVERRFSVAGLRRVRLEEVEVEDARDRWDLLAKLRLRALSTFEHLTNEEAEQGFSATEADIVANGNRGSLRDVAMLLVFEKP
jgi:hypothetical protein